VPKFREKFDIKHVTQITYTCRSTSTAFEPNNAFNCGYMIKAPTSEVVFEVNQLLTQLIKLPMFFDILID